MVDKMASKNRRRQGWEAESERHRLAKHGIHTKQFVHVIEHPNYKTREMPNGEFEWMVLRDSGAVYDSGVAGSEHDAQTLVQQNLKEMCEEESHE
jgi:hypothetical protein